jgi:hypothetical protein
MIDFFGRQGTVDASPKWDAKANSLFTILIISEEMIG